MSRQEAERIAAAIARAERPHFDAYGNEVRRILIQSHMRTAEAVLADLADAGLLADPADTRLRDAAQAVLGRMQKRDGIWYAPPIATTGVSYGVVGASDALDELHAALAEGQRP